MELLDSLLPRGREANMEIKNVSLPYFDDISGIEFRVWAQIRYPT